MDRIHRNTLYQIVCWHIYTITAVPKLQLRHSTLCCLLARGKAMSFSRNRKSGTLQRGCGILEGITTTTLQRAMSAAALVLSFVRPLPPWQAIHNIRDGIMSSIAASDFAEAKIAACKAIDNGIFSTKLFLWYGLRVVRMCSCICICSNFMQGNMIGALIVEFREMVAIKFC